MTFDGIIPVSSLGFRSALIDAVAAMDFRSMPAPQLLARIKKTPGIKKEEIEDLGLQAWLESADKKIRKENVLEFIRQGGPKLVEIVKKGEFEDIMVAWDPEWTDVQDAQYKRGSNDMLIKHDLKKGSFLLFNNDSEMLFDDIISEEAAKAVANAYEHANKPPSETRYTRYQLPHGSNYREVLFTLPTESRFELSESDIEIVSKRLLKRGYAPLDQEGREALAKQDSKSLAMLEDFQDRLGVNLKDFIKSSIYSSPHWPEFNVLAHVRLNDRFDDKGNKILFIEELQSDWHQRGRDVGYGPKPIFGIFNGEGILDATRPTKEEATLFAAENGYPESSVRTAPELGTHGLPNAPFKKSWPILVMKRVLRMAAEQGYDAVAWTPGKVQADRYDLQKYIDRIEYEPCYDDKGRPTGQYEFITYGVDGGKILEQDEAGLEYIEEALGKEVAAKFEQLEGKPFGDSIYRDWRVLKGSDLPAGGSKFASFYDKQLRNLFHKHIQRLDKNSCVQAIDVVIDETILSAKHSLTGTPRPEARVQETTPVWGAFITPKINSEVLTGQALYQMPTPNQANDDMEM